MNQSEHSTSLNVTQGHTMFVQYFRRFQTTNGLTNIQSKHQYVAFLKIIMFRLAATNHIHRIINRQIKEP